jgi:hypothetical protein
MTHPMYAAKANCMAAAARVRFNGSCQASPAVSVWSPISLGTTTDKHGRPRRLGVSHL